jgi:hypothetical protein
MFNNAKILSLAVIAVMGMVFLPMGAAADVATIDVASPAQLREAIDTVNLGADPNINEVVIRLAAGTYALEGAAASEDDLNAVGDLDIRPGGNVAIVTLEPAVPGATVILDGAGTFRILDVFPHTSIPFALHLNNVGLQNGSVDGYGGAILIRPSTPADAIRVTMAGVSISSNTAMASGGGIGIGPGSTIEMIDSAIVDNLTYFNGGGVFCFGGSANFYSTRMTGNQAAPPATGIGGGAIFNAGGTIVVDNASTIANNRTAEDGIYGGALANSGFGEMTVNAAITADNGNGTGLYNQFGGMTVNFSKSGLVLRGDVIILAGTVTFNIDGVLTFLGDLIQPDGEFILNGRLRYTAAMPWIPLLILND